MIKKFFKYEIGIDEVGRGPIAGPVAVGAFVFLSPLAKKLFKGVKESKQLTEEKREEWFKKIQEIRKVGLTDIKKNQKTNSKLIDFAVTFQSEKIIDHKGLSFAIKNALAISLKKIIKNNSIKPENALVLLDGGLKAPKEYINQKTIIKGDEKEMVIALASVCAKVSRDRKMRKWAIEFPQYGFDIHKGYGTKRHYEAIERHGLCVLHRRSFIRKMI